MSLGSFLPWWTSRFPISQLVRRLSFTSLTICPAFSFESTCICLSHFSKTGSVISLRPLLGSLVNMCIDELLTYDPSLESQIIPSSFNTPVFAGFSKSVTESDRPDNIGPPISYSAGYLCCRVTQFFLPCGMQPARHSFSKIKRKLPSNILKPLDVELLM